MASKTRKTRTRRKLKRRPNLKNLKTDFRRIQKNAQILKELEQASA